MVAYNKFNQTVEDVMEGVYTASTDQFTVALCAAANAPVATNSVAKMEIIGYLLD